MLHNRCTSVLQVCDCHAKWSSVYHIQFYLEDSWRSWYCNVRHGILCTDDATLLWTQRPDCCKSTHWIFTRYPGLGWSWYLFWRATKLHHFCVWNYNESVPLIQLQAILDCCTCTNRTTGILTQCTWGLGRANFWCIVIMPNSLSHFSNTLDCIKTKYILWVEVCLVFMKII